MSEVIEIQTAELIITDDGDLQILEVAMQGPPGVGGSAGAFMIDQRFSEIASDENAKAQARTNLGLQYIDGGTFN